MVLFTNMRSTGGGGFACRITRTGSVEPIPISTARITAWYANDFIFGRRVVVEESRWKKFEGFRWLLESVPITGVLGTRTRGPAKSERRLYPFIQSIYFPPILSLEKRSPMPSLCLSSSSFYFNSLSLTNLPLTRLLFLSDADETWLI